MVFPEGFRGGVVFIMRLIDADALLYRLADYQLQESPGWGANGYGNSYAYEAITNCMDAIESAPTIEPERNNDAIWQALGKVYNMPGLPDEAYSIIGDVMLALGEPDRKTGRWIKPKGMMPPEHHGHYECSECGAWAGRNWLKPWKEIQLSNFCPNCGAKMEGGE